MTTQTMAVDAPLAAAAVTTPCERCGSFSDKLAPLGTAKLCPACLDRVLASERFWPAGYLTGVGVLLNPTLSLVLLSLNHRRLGDLKAARAWLIGAVVLGALYVGIMLSDLPIPNSALYPASAIAGFSIGRTFKPQWETLKAVGAKRANVWLPPLLFVLALFGIAVVAAFLSPES